MEKFAIWFAETLGTFMPKEVAVFIISMIPLIELRGAVPVGVFLQMEEWKVILIAVIGNMLPVPFIHLFARRILEWGKDKPIIGKPFGFCLEKGERGGKKLQEKAKGGVFVALLLFVGIPLPGTGAWTGTLAASILNLDFKKSVLAVFLGVLLAGAIMLLVSMGAVSAVNAVVK